jgi:protein-S-isoprenylcysteine O-methyltransferase Ste14
MRLNHWFYRLRAYLVTPPLIVASFCFFHETEGLVWPLGILVFLIGFMLRLWAQEHLHYRLKIRKQLTITGPYRFVRNPAYIGNVLIGLGATLVSELVWMIPITFLWYAIAYRFVVCYEETHLSEKYGEAYQTYKSEVPRWLPRLPGFSGLGLVNRFLYASVLKESHCFFILFPYIIKELLSHRLGL